MIPPCLILSNIRYLSRVKWSNPGKGVVPSPSPRCRSYWKGSLLVAPWLGSPTLLYSFRSQFLGFILLLGSSFLSRINLDNCVLLVSCVELLRRKFTLSLSKNQVDHCFLLLDEYLSVSTWIFICWIFIYGGFYHIFWLS